jgi:hypothetical protein
VLTATPSFRPECHAGGIDALGIDVCAGGTVVLPAKDGAARPVGEDAVETLTARGDAHFGAVDVELRVGNRRERSTMRELASSRRIVMGASNDTMGTHQRVAGESRQSDGKISFTKSYHDTRSEP